MDRLNFQACIDACNACADACDFCSAACLSEKDVAAMARCIA
ncbi:MAG: four-helix bundle copper-binding protein, partial [Massilia sp.]